MSHPSRNPGWPFYEAPGAVPTTIAELQVAIETSKLSSVALTELCLNRILRIDPWLGAVETVNPDALKSAAHSDRSRSPGARGPLEGIPVLLKANLDTDDPMPTTAGSRALLDATPARDAGVVQRLRDAGAVLLGKTNMTEWMDYRSERAIGGWSAVRGQTHSPHVLDRTPSGSSSGSAAAVAASLAPLGIGTETDGSIVNTCGATGVVGIKPTVGLVSRSGIVPLSPNQDTPGPMARTVTDAAIALFVMQGIDDRDPATARAAEFVGRDYRRSLDGDVLEGKRIGVWRAIRHPEVESTLRRSIAALRDRGAHVVEGIELDIEHAAERSDAAKLVEFKAAIDAYLAATPGVHPADLSGLIAFNRAWRRYEMPVFGQELFEAAERTGGDLDDAVYREHRRVATESAQRAIDSALERNRLDLLTAPTNAPAVGLRERGVGSSSPAAIAGYPNVTVPAGWAWGQLPLGVSFFASAWSEPLLIGAAYAFEQETRAHRPPAFRPTLSRSDTDGN